MFMIKCNDIWRLEIKSLFADHLLTFYKVNSLAPGVFQRNFSEVIFQLILVMNGRSIYCKIVLKWMPMDLNDGKSTLVQVMAWCRQATSHYLSQCWPRSLSPYMASLGHNELIGTAIAVIIVIITAIVVIIIIFSQTTAAHRSQWTEWHCFRLLSAISLVPGPCLNIKNAFPMYGIPMLKIRQSWDPDRLIFDMEIPIPVRWHLYIEMPPRSLYSLLVIDL